MAIRKIHCNGPMREDEAVATAVAISPGMLVERTSAGLVQAHSTEGGDAAVIVALEDNFQGKTVDDAYAVSTLIFLGIPRKGTKMNMLLKAGENVAIGDNLVSAGDGTLIAEGSVASGTTVEQVIAKAAEAKDLSASGAANALMAVEIV